MPSPRGITPAILQADVGDVEVLDPPRAALAREQALPGGLDAAAERRHHAQPGDDDAPHHAAPYGCQRNADDAPGARRARPCTIAN